MTTFLIEVWKVNKGFLRSTMYAKWMVLMRFKSVFWILVNKTQYGRCRLIPFVDVYYFDSNVFTGIPELETKIMTISFEFRFLNYGFGLEIKWRRQCQDEKASKVIAELFNETSFKTTED